MSSGSVETRIENRVLYVTIMRAEKRNNLSSTVLTELKAAFDGAADNPDLVGAVLTAEGDKAFAAGGDLKEFDAARTPETAREIVRVATEGLDAVRNFPLPVIAALNGDALGGGAELAVACDMRVFAAHAKIGFIQSSLAISTGWGGGDHLRRIVGSTRALRILIEAERLSADEALAAGLADRIAGEGELAQAVETELAVLRKRPPQVLRAIKSVTRPPRDAETAARETEKFIECWLHDDHWAVHDRIMSSLTKKP